MDVAPPDPTATESPFEQLRVQLARRVASGELAPGTKLPTVRGLAEQLGLAPGTVARAYRELEADGVLVTEGRRGTFVASTRTAPDEAAAAAAATAAATTYAATARRLGLALPEAQRLVEAAWGQSATS